jgi:hypothetical protein
MISKLSRLLKKIITVSIAVIITKSIVVNFFDGPDLLNIYIKPVINWNLIYFLIFIRVIFSLISNYLISHLQLSKNN